MRQICAIIAIMTAFTVKAGDFGNQETYFCESFSTTMPESFVTADLDGQQIYFTMIQAGFDQGDAWKCLREKGSSNYYVASTSKYKSVDGIEPQPSNDWLITPAVRILDTDATLTWRANSISDNTAKSDTYSIYISTMGNSPENFTSAPICTVENETLNEWTTHSVSLSGFYGKDVYIAFVNQSHDCEILAIDDIAVTGGPGIYVLSSNVPENLFGTEEVDFGLHLISYSMTEEVYNSFKVYAEIAGQSYTLDYNISDIGHLREFDFTLDEINPIKVSYGETVDYTIWGELDGRNTNIIKGSVSAHLFNPERRTVIEEGTGMWCRYCPLGIIAFDRMKEKYGDDLIAIALHYDDFLAVDEYVVPMLFDQYPSGWINRKIQASPMVETEIGGKTEYTTENGGWETYFLEAQSEIAKAEFKITSAVLDSENRINVSTETRFAGNYPDAGYRQVFVLVEDGVEGYQINGFSGSDYSLDGWENLPEDIMPYTFNDVARGVAEDWQGVECGLPASPTVGEPYSFDYQFNAPLYNDYQNLRLVAMLLDKTTGEIINASESILDTSSIETVFNDNIKIEVVCGKVFINGETPEIHTLTGIRIPNKNLTAGIYIAVLKDGTKTITRKITIN